MATLQSAAQFAEQDDELDLADIGRTLVRRWRVIFLVTAFTTLIALWITLFSRPQFVVDGTMYLGASQSGADAAGALSSSGLNFLTDFQSVSDVATQVSLIQAKALLEKAILETGLNASMTREDAQPLVFWRWRFDDHESIDAFAPQPDDLKVVDATIADAGQRGAGFLVVFDGGGQYRLVTGSSGGWFGSPGRTVVSGVLNKPASGGGISLMIKPATDGFTPAAGARYMLSIAPAKSVADGLLAGPLAVSAGGTGSSVTNVADVTMAWGNPFQSRDFVNQLMADFIATQLSWKTESASATEDFVAVQLEKIRTSLDQADRNLAAYQSKTGIVDVPANAQALISQLSQYEVQRTTLLLQQEALQQLTVAVAHPLTDVNPYLVSQTNDPVLSQLANNLATAEVQLQAQSVQFTGQAPETRAQQATIAKIEDAMRSVIANDQALATRSLANLDNLIGKFEGQLKGMPAEALQVIALTRSSDVLGQLYVLLMQKEEEAEVSKAATIVDTRIVTPADIPLQATKPKAAATVLTGMVLGIFAGIGLVLGLRAISGRFQSDDEIRRAVPLPVYALIPRRRRTEAAAGIFSAMPQSPFSEAFRLLRSNLYQSASMQKSRVILVTSASSSDGKTTTASNLAKILADDGKAVVLVDADLHRGRAHEALKLNQAPGLTEWLVTGQQQRLQPVEGQRFVVLTAGLFPPNPSELLNESQLGEVFDALRAAFAFIIVDCPPLPAVADTMSLGQHADLLLSVVNISHTSRRAFMIHNETVGTLDRRHGIIINGVVGSAYGYGYGDGYGYGYGSGGNGRGAPTRLQKLRDFAKRFF